MADKLVPGVALDYIKNKKLKPAFSYKDVWNEEHATAFTVAKAMQVDVLQDIKGAVKKAIADGQNFEQFKKNIKPTLQQKGWWGKKEMTDPLTGKTVNAQLGSDRRLQTIYNTNLRSAYQKGTYDRTMASDVHPYLMYRIGPSQRHREQHASWNGLVLPKEDPFWNQHYPPNDWGCKCYAVAVSESRKQRLEQSGISVPPSSQVGSDGGIIRIKTAAPKEVYTTFFNERTGTLERLPKGVAPGFGWNQGLPRNTANLQNVVTKTREKAPEQFDAVINALLKSAVNKNEHYGFIENALAKKLDGKALSPVGVFDSTVTDFLHKNKLIHNNQSLIMLESKLVTSRKYSGKHTLMQNAPETTDWYNLLDYLIDASVYYDGKGLIYLFKKSESVYVKIAVDLASKAVHKGTTINLPKIDTMYLLDISSESTRGFDSYKDILKMKKIR